MESIKLEKSESYQQRKKFVDGLFRVIFRSAGLLSTIFIVLIFVFILEKGIKVFLPAYEWATKFIFF